MKKLIFFAKTIFISCLISLSIFDIIPIKSHLLIQCTFFLTIIFISQWHPIKNPLKKMLSLRAPPKYFSIINLLKMSWVSICFFSIANVITTFAFYEEGTSFISNLFQRETLIISSLPTYLFAIICWGFFSFFDKFHQKKERIQYLISEHKNRVSDYDLILGDAECVSLNVIFYGKKIKSVASGGKAIELVKKITNYKGAK